MQNVAKPASESGNVNTRSPATSSSSAKPSKSQGNSVPKSSQNAGRSQTTSAQQTHPSNQNHKTVTVTDLASSSTALATEIAIQQVKQSRSYHQYMPDSSDSDSDDVLSVSCRIIVKMFSVHIVEKLVQHPSQLVETDQDINDSKSRPQVFHSSKCIL